MGVAADPITAKPGTFFGEEAEEWWRTSFFLCGVQMPWRQKKVTELDDGAQRENRREL